MTNYVVIGCGGIGSKLVPELARMTFREPGNLILVDGKGVRSHNVDRQFSITEVGLNKARAMAGNLRSMLPTSSKLEVTVIEQYLSESLIHEHPWTKSKDQTVVFCCVDNKPSRIFIEDVVDQMPNVWLISSGNDTISGQAVITVKKHNEFVKPFDKFPSDLDPTLHDMDDDRTPDQIPCDEAIMSEPQISLANMGAAFASLGLWYAQKEQNVCQEINEVTFNIEYPHVSPARSTNPVDRKFVTS
jgi:molybdopterin/thiamine biosynthesis adenylyltransferase